MKADHYYGVTAEHYDSKREGTKKRDLERSILAEMVDMGPVLDVACGTGAFFPIYREKGLAFTGVDKSPDMLRKAQEKFPDAKLGKASALDLPFEDREFRTAVCIRFLEWLPADLLAKAISELKRVASTVICTIRLGPAGEGKNYTHPQEVFYRLIDGLLIDRRELLVDEGATRNEILKLRPATWADAVASLAFDYAEPHKIALRSDKFGAAFGLDPVPVTEEMTTVRAEYWTSQEIGEMLLEMAKRWDHTRPPKHRFIHDKEPRRSDLPITVVERGGVRLIIDGRHRANQWMKQSTRHPVIVVRPR